MPEYIRALFIILLLAGTVHLLATPAFAGLSFTRADHMRRWGAWLAVTLVAFLAQNPWLYAIGFVAILYVVKSSERNALALFFFLLFALPMAKIEVPGFGVANYLLNLDHARILSLFLLFPAYLYLRKQPGTLPFLSTLPDKFLLAFILLSVLLMYRMTTATDTLRQGLYGFLDIFLPYYVASRGARNMHLMREALAAFVAAAMILGVVAFVEYSKSWLLYTALGDSVGDRWLLGIHIRRADALRAIATTVQPIALGYVMMVALAFFYFLRHYVASGVLRAAIFGVLLAGLFAPLSRGPWVGFLVFLIAYHLLGRRPLEGGLKIVVAGMCGVAAAFVLPGGQAFIDLLPFVGTVDSFNVDYRERLLEQSLAVVARNPFLGSVTYRAAPEMLAMIQGQGIIDLVNTYLAIALEYGLIGLFLFAGFFFTVLVAVRKASERARQGGREDYRVLGLMLFSALGAILVTIYTVSSITVIPWVYWSVAGLGVAYAQMTQDEV